MGRDLCKQEEGQCCGPTEHHCLPGTLQKRQGVTGVFQSLERKTGLRA